MALSPELQTCVYNSSNILNLTFLNYLRSSPPQQPYSICSLPYLTPFFYLFRSKTLELSLIFFLSYTHLTHQKILLVLPSKYIRNLFTSQLFHLGPRYSSLTFTLSSLQSILNTGARVVLLKYKSCESFPP